MNEIKFCELRLDYESKDLDKIINKLKFPRFDEIKNKRIGILVGSRGIKNLNKIVLKIIEEIKDLGGIPYIIPAMGSHGGGTVKGQISILKKYGISSDTMKTEVVLSKNYLKLGEIFEDRPVLVNAVAGNMDFLIGINRIKPHPRFSGNYESGLLKLLAVGLGFFEGAKNFHRTANQYGFENILIKTSNLILKNFNFLYFVGIVEDRLSSTLKIQLIDPDNIYKEEEKMLVIARENMPYIPLHGADLLIINEMGKNYSGGGIDTCIVGGRKGKERFAKRTYVRKLSAESNSNAIGIGLVDFISDSFFNSIDFNKTYKNALSSMQLNSVKIPIHFSSDKEVLEYAAESIGKLFDENFKIVFIDNTSNLSRILVTPNMMDQDLERYKLKHIIKIMFDNEGNLMI